MRLTNQSAVTTAGLPSASHQPWRTGRTASTALSGYGRSGGPPLPTLPSSSTRLSLCRRKAHITPKPLQFAPTTEPPKRCKLWLGQNGHAAHHCVRPHRRSPTHAGRLVHQPRESKRQPQQAALGPVTKNGKRRDSLSLDTERHSVLMTCVTCVSRVRSGRGAVAACHRPCATLPPCAKHTPHRSDSRRSAPARNACCSPGWLTTFSM